MRKTNSDVAAQHRPSARGSAGAVCPPVPAWTQSRAPEAPPQASPLPPLCSTVQGKDLWVRIRGRLVRNHSVGLDFSSFLCVLVALLTGGDVASCWAHHAQPPWPWVTTSWDAVSMGSMISKSKLFGYRESSPVFRAGVLPVVERQQTLFDQVQVLNSFSLKRWCHELLAKEPGSNQPQQLVQQWHNDGSSEAH